MKGEKLPAKRNRTNSTLDYLRGTAKFYRDTIYTRKETRLSLIKRLVIKKGQYCTGELRKDLSAHGIKVDPSTIRRDLGRLKRHKQFIVSVHVNGNVPGKTTVIRFRTKASPAS